MNDGQAEEYLNSFVNYENIPGISYTSIDYNLKHVEELLHRVGNPHLTAKTIHIAGTKGKGSTAAMIAQVLQTSGYKTGLYTSPHLHTIRERIRVDGSLISQVEFTALIAELKPYFDAINHDSLYRQLTFFEALTVLAFSYFSENRIDFQVLESGLGGRLDATNVAKPEVCVITSISIDHTQILGDSLSKIAYEKAGIIKPGSSVVISPQSKEASSVIYDVCRQQRAKVVQVGREVTYHGIAADLRQQSLIVESKRGSYRLTIPLLGDYQLENAATAVATLDLLASKGFHISAENIAQGLAMIQWPGRFQILSHQPTVLIDGAHNVASMKKLVDNIKEYFDYETLFLIIGTSCDKDIAAMVQELLLLSPVVITTHSPHPRSASPSAIASEFAKLGSNPMSSDTVGQALDQALSLAKDRDLICITGSLFIVAEALDYFPRVKF